MSERLYEDLAPWWPLLTPPEDYAEEAEVYLGLLTEALGQTPESLLELGSAGGHLATHLPLELDLVLLDRAPAMLAISRGFNPDRTHVEADMRTVRLERRFDAVLLHDAVMYLTSEADLRSAYASAFAHCRPGGVFLVLPDVTRESFEEATVAGGGSGEDGRAIRLMEWAWDPDPGDCTFQVEMAFVLREADGSTRIVHESHTMGLFARRDHVRLLREVGFELVQPDLLLAVECGEIFLARRPETE